MKLIKKSISKAEIAAMPKVLFPGRIFVVYTESDAEKAVAYLKDQRIVGVDTETRPSFKRKPPTRWHYCKFLLRTLVFCSGLTVLACLIRCRSF